MLFQGTKKRSFPEAQRGGLTGGQMSSKGQSVTSSDPTVSAETWQEKRDSRGSNAGFLIVSFLDTPTLILHRMLCVQAPAEV